MPWYGVHEKIVRLLNAPYFIVSPRVKIDGELSDILHISTGCRQGSILSPTLFNIVLDFILRCIVKAWGKGNFTYIEDVIDTEYADDTALLAECLEQIMKLTALLAGESQKWGLKLSHAKKTKIMPVTKKQAPHPQVQINSNEVEVVQRFVYLGSETDANCSCDTEMRWRVVLAGSVMNRLSTSIFRRQDVSLDLKLRLFNSYVVPIFTHGSEWWILTNHMENRLDACENRWLRRIMRITYTDRITNDTIRQRTQQLPVSNRLRQMQLIWLKRVIRMKDNRLTKSVHQWKPTGKRSRGRPNKRWMDCIEEDLRRAGVTRCGKQQEDKERHWTTLLLTDNSGGT